jgi:hypothetical protein
VHADEAVPGANETLESRLLRRSEGVAARAQEHDDVVLCERCVLEVGRVFTARQLPVPLFRERRERRRTGFDRAVPESGGV